MKQNIPMPVAIGAIVGVIVIALAFVFMRGNTKDAGFDQQSSRQMQEAAYKKKMQGNPGATAPAGNRTSSGN